MRSSDSYSVIPDKPPPTSKKGGISSCDNTITQQPQPLHFDIGQRSTQQPAQEREEKCEDTLHDDFINLLEKLESDPSPTGDQAIVILTKRIQSFFKIQRRIDRAGLFSNNETVDDVHTESLKFCLCPHYISEAYARFCSNESSREQALELSKKFGKRFLNRMVQWEVLHKDDQQEFEAYDAPPDEIPSLDPGSKRQRKINAFKRNKDAAQRLQKLSEGRKKRKLAGMEEGEFWDESLERDLWLAQITVAVRTTLNTLSNIKSELPLAKRMDEMRRKSGRGGKLNKLPRELPKLMPKEARSGKEPKVTKFLPNGQRIDFKSLAEFEKYKSMDELVAEKADGRSQVIRDNNPWTITVEQALEIDIKSGEVIMESKPAPEKKHVDDMTDEERHTALKKKREWDKWTDDHQKGAGNFIGRGFSHEKSFYQD
jgi:immunoglobulin-binding protein 1